MKNPLRFERCREQQLEGCLQLAPRLLLPREGDQEILFLDGGVETVRASGEYAFADVCGGANMTCPPYRARSRTLDTLAERLLHWFKDHSIEYKSLPAMEE